MNSESNKTTREHPIRRILVAIDDSPHSPKELLAVAFELARGANAKVCLYHAVSVPQDFPAGAHTNAIDALPRYMHREAEARLNAFALEAPALSCDVVVEESAFAGDAVVRAADRYDADLIAIGKHKYGILERTLGTTAAHVVRTSSRDVLAVSSDVPKGSRCVLACLDSSRWAPEVLRAATTIARARGLSVQPFRVITGAGELSPSRQELIAEGVADLERITGAAPPPRSLLKASAGVDETAWKAICLEAKETLAEVIVVGGKRTGALSSFLTTASHVIQHSPAHVLVVRLAE